VWLALFLPFIVCYDCLFKIQEGKSMTEETPSPRTGETGDATQSTRPTEATTSPPSEEMPRSDEMVRCALTGKEIPANEAYWAPPLITTWQLIKTIVSNLVRSPGNLGMILFEKQDDVPYAPDARDELASRRTIEQLKLLGVLLVILALIVVPILLVWQ
jgi:hypothetical protein